MRSLCCHALTAFIAATIAIDIATAQDNPKDWPMYNRDVLGTRHNRGETAIDRSNAGRLEEKWRFPAKGSDLEIGVIHATPVVVDGYVYFGTATDPTFYKLTPDGKVRWSYRNPHLRSDRRSPRRMKRRRNARFHVARRAASSPRRWSPRTPSSSATSAAGSMRWTGRPGRSAGSSTRGTRSSPAPTR